MGLNFEGIWCLNYNISGLEWISYHDLKLMQKKFQFFFSIGKMLKARICVRVWWMKNLVQICTALVYHKKRVKRSFSLPPYQTAISNPLNYIFIFFPSPSWIFFCWMMWNYSRLIWLQSWRPNYCTCGSYNWLISATRSIIGTENTLFSTQKNQFSHYYCRNSVQWTKYVEESAIYCWKFCL